ncbi:MAG TPA: Crp/Fnr family transcriptional regulator [Streptosporangiaceae bacterium]|jgi:CRP-like cAMP-binding protein
MIPEQGEPGSFLSHLSLKEAADLERRGRRRHWRRGAVIFAEGEQSMWALLLLAGRVKTSSHTASGTEVLLAIRGPGALLGEVSAVDGLPRYATATALEPLDAIVLPAEEFTGFLREHAWVAALLMRTLCERLRDADHKRIEFGAHDATERVARRLTELADRFGEPHHGGVRINLALTQGELAGWVGASREAVSKALRGLRTRGWIETGRRTLVVHDLEALRKRARK